MSMILCGIYEGARGKVGCGCTRDLHDWRSILVGMVLLCRDLSG